MKILLPAALSLVVPALGSLIPTPGQLFEGVDEYLYGQSGRLEVQENYFDETSGVARKLCTLKSAGEGGDDTDDFVKAIEECGKGGVVKLPDPVYTISRPLELTMEQSTLDVHGFLTMTDDVQYWIDNRIEFAFQNQSLAIVISGHDFTLDGHDTGGIDGNGQAWYEYAGTYGNKYGRPMSLAIANASDVVIKNFSIKQPQFWASIIIRSKNVIMRDIYVNATNYNPEAADSPDGKSWLQNTDGLDVYISNNVTIENFVYQGGDDCLSVKPNGTDIIFRNITCIGSTGIALGSIAQYEGVFDIMENILIEDVKLYPSNQCLGFQGLLLKSWLGDSHGTPPNGGGGGEGYARNITFRDIYMEDMIRPIVLTSTLTYLPDIEPSPGKFEWYDLHFENITATGKYNRLVWADCSPLKPCHGFTFKDIKLTPQEDDHPELNYVCNNFIMDGETGLDQCHPSASKLETGEDGSPHK